MKKNISILGCGWLGFPLAKHLMDLGCQIKGSTTSKSKIEELTQQGIDGHYIRLSTEKTKGHIDAFLADGDILVINIPPGLRSYPSKNHFAEILNLVEAIENSSVQKVLYVSSISVFKDEEDNPIIHSSIQPNNTTNAAKQLIEIENLLRYNKNFETNILRFGGLFGKDRHPAKHLAGKTNLSNPEAPINLIHLQDGIEIIASILEIDLWNTSLNACYPSHPTKSKYYTNYCLQHNLPLPSFNSEGKSKGKIIDSSELVRLLKYTFKQAP